jgi:hypothetical protein
MSAIDALPKNELRRLTQALIELLGPHALVSLVPELRVESTEEAPQLALGLVDLEATRRDAQEWLFAVMAAARLRAATHAIAMAVDGPAASGALAAGLADLTQRAQAALAYDAAAGLDLAAFIATVAARSIDIAAAYPSDAWHADRVLEPMPSLADALVAAASGFAADDATVASVVQCCRVFDRMRLDHPYALLAAWVDTEREARMPALRRAAAATPATPSTVPMLALVAERTVSSTADALVQCAELHHAHSPSVASLLVETLERVGHDDQANYWRGELRARRA